MSLDNNLFTLWFTPSEQVPGDVDCIDPQSSEVIYRKRQRNVIKGPEYFWSLIDPLSDALLASVTALSAIAKTKTITLHDPDVPVQLSFSGTMSFKWSFTWETHEFEWRKDSCYLIRKPDPPVQVAVTDPAKKGKPASVQVLDYNLRRFDIDDRKGLEIVMLCALLSFTDYYEGHRQPTTPPTASVTPSGSRPTRTSFSATPQSLAAGSASAPSPPPPPPPRIQLSSSEPNEITVTEEGSISEYAQHCATVLADPDILFIIIRSSSSDVVQRVVQVAQETKRLRHRASDEEEDLHQYLTYDEEKDPSKSAKKPKRVIRLDDKPEPKKDPSYKPLTTLTIHLSKIPMPELMPKNTPTISRPPASPSPNASSSSSRPSRPSSRPSPSPASASSASSSRPSAPSSGRLQKPAAGGRHGRSSSAEPRPIPNNQTRPPSSSNPKPKPNSSSQNKLSPNPRPGPGPGMPKPRPVSAYEPPIDMPVYMPPGSAPRQQQPGWLPQAWSSGSGAPVNIPQPATPQYPTSPPQQQPQPPASGTQSAMSMIGKLLSRI